MQETTTKVQTDAGAFSNQITNQSFAGPSTSNSPTASRVKAMKIAQDEINRRSLCSQGGEGQGLILHAGPLINNSGPVMHMSMDESASCPGSVSQTRASSNIIGMQRAHIGGNKKAGRNNKHMANSQALASIHQQKKRSIQESILNQA